MSSLILTLILTLSPQAPPVRETTQAPPVRVDNDNNNKEEDNTYLSTRKTPMLQYADASRMALETGKPLVVFVGCPIQLVNGCISVGVPNNKWPEYPAKCILVSSPFNGVIYWHKTLPIDASENDIVVASRPIIRAIPTYQPPPQMFFGGGGGGFGGRGGGGC